MDGPRRIAQDNRLPIASTRAHTPARGKDIIFVSSSPPSSTAPLTPAARRVRDSSHDGSEVIASSPQPSIQVSKKRKAFVDSPSSQSDDDDLYVADPKPKRVKAGSQKAAAAKNERKVKGKGKEAVGKEKGKEKEKERPARSRQSSKKTIKSVAFIEDEDSSSSDDKQPPVRPKPKPAYRGANALQDSLPESQKESQKVADSVPVGKHVAKRMGSNSLPIVPVGPTTDPRTPAVPTVPASAASPPAPVAPPTPLAPTAPPVPRNPPPPIAPPAPPATAAPPVPTCGSAPLASDNQYLPHEPHPPHGYDEHSRYYHGRPPARAMDNHFSMQPPMLYRDPGPPRYPGDGGVPPERYAYRGDYYGYAPHSHEYYAPQYLHNMQPSGQPSYPAPPPTAYNQHPRHDPQQLDIATALPRGSTGNATASSSRLSPFDHHSKSA
jgi:hypothetical protein